MKRIIIILGLIFLNFQLSTLNSQNIIRPKISCPNDIYVNSYNGVLFYQRADLSIPNRSMPLEAVFYYNSSYADTNYGYGRGWTLGYEYRYSGDSSSVTIMSGDGRKDTYTRNADSSFRSPTGVFHTLTALSNGGYSLRTKEGVVYTFADTASKQVTQIRDRNNNALSFAYTNGNLYSISDDNGRSIILTWTDTLMTSLKANVSNRTWQYAYDTLGNLVCVTNPMGYSVHYGYDKANRINRFTDEAGYSTLIFYNSDGQVHRVKTDLTDKSIRYDKSSNLTVIIDYMGDSLAHNQFTTYVWDEQGRVIEKTGNCCGYITKLVYDNNNNVIRSEDGNGNISTCTYDSNGNMITRTDPMGYTEYYTYELINNNILTHTDKLGNQYTFAYDTNGNLTSLTGPMDITEYYTYNRNGQLLTQTDALGHTTTYTYDQYGNMSATTNTLGNSMTMQYNTLGNMTSIVTPTGNLQQYNYDALQRISSIIDPLGNRMTFQYDPLGNILSMTDPFQHSVRTTYDALSRPVSMTDAANATSVIIYNAKDNPIQIENPLHNTVRREYNDRNQMVLAVDALGDSTHYEYDAVGNLIMATMPNGRQIVYTYDANSRQVQVVDQYGIIQKTIYDAMGRTIATINANGDTTHMTYDALGRLTQSTDPLGHTEQYSYDLAGNMLTHTDANGNTTTYTYDAVGNLLTETDALNNVTTYTYNADGELTSVTDANGNATHYQYDATNRLTLITFANGKTQQFWYDAAGNAIRYKDEDGNQTMMAYDANGNLLSHTYPDGSSDQYTYDLNGNMLTANNANANITFTYDANGQVLSEQMYTIFNSQLSTLNYEYDKKNGHIQITYPSGRQVTEQYDLRGRLSTILNSKLSTLNSTDTIAKYTYYPTDYVASRTYGNGDVTNYTYDAANRLTSINSINSIQPILSLHYSYDNSGNILSKIDSLHSDRSESYGYDALHRLTSFQRGQANNSGVIPNPLKQIQYTLDALGNRTSVTANGTTTTYAHNNMNAYTTAGNETMQYDGNGNMTSDGNHTYQYNYRNRIISVDNGSTATYQYDALDRRIVKMTSSDTILYYYRGVQALEERTITDTTTYIYGISIDDILSMHRNRQDFYYHKNHLGSVMAITNNSGSLVETSNYDPYGTLIVYNVSGTEIGASVIGNTILFTGREYDFETGLYYYRARTMNHSFGRFIQQDPLMFVDGFNMFQYVNSNPINLTDHLGLFSLCDIICNIPPSIRTVANTISWAENKYSTTIGNVQTYQEVLIRNVSISSEGKISVRKIFHRLAIGSRSGYKTIEHIEYFKKIDHFVQSNIITKKLAERISIASRVIHISTLINTVRQNYCTGSVWSWNLLRPALDVVADYEIVTNTFLLGWDIGTWITTLHWSEYVRWQVERDLSGVPSMAKW